MGDLLPTSGEMLLTSATVCGTIGTIEMRSPKTGEAPITSCREAAFFVPEGTVKELVTCNCGARNWNSDEYGASDSCWNCGAPINTPDPSDDEYWAVLAEGRVWIDPDTGLPAMRYDDEVL